MIKSNEIADIVIDYFGLEKELFNSNKRQRELVYARQLSHFLSKKNTNESLNSIGSNCGKKNHATVLYSCRTILDLKGYDKAVQEDIKNIQKLISDDIVFEIGKVEITEAINSAIINRFAHTLNQLNSLKDIIR